jgi:putative ABC transport system ATP-binding protein
MPTKNTQIKIDLVCGMDLSEYEGLSNFSHNGITFYFCGTHCEERFQKNPDRFQGVPLIRLHKVRKVFDLGGIETKVLMGLDIHVWEGDFVAIVGPSGSGKSTALNIIGLLDKPTSGSILLKNDDVSLLGDDDRAELRSKTFGFVFQQYNLIPWLTAFENTTLPLIFSGKKIEVEKITANFEEMNLKERMNHRPFELSGGEQQRTALLRAFANNPDIILGDEPTGNLDSITGGKILEILIKLNRVNKKTLVIVTHDTDIAAMADQVITMKDGKMVPSHNVHKKFITESVSSSSNKSHD